MGLFDSLKKAVSGNVPNPMASGQSAPAADAQAAAAQAAAAANAQTEQLMAQQQQLMAQYASDMSPEDIQARLQSAAAEAQSGDPVARQAMLKKQQDFIYRLKEVRDTGVHGEGTILAVNDVPESDLPDFGKDWKEVQVEVRLPGRDPYVATMKHMVPAISADHYAVGATHNLAVDNNDPNLYSWCD